MKKADIIAKTIHDMARKHERDAQYKAEVVVPTLNERVPEGDSKTCEDFKHLNLECCETCHTFYAHYEMDAVDLPDGSKAWICHAVKSALIPEKLTEKEAARRKVMDAMLTAESDSPAVGIFWLLPSGKLIIDCSPLSEAEMYSNALTHSTGHLDHWTELQKQGIVPNHVEYEDWPRGRISLDLQKEQFILLADKCILERRDVVQGIVVAFHLPPELTSEGLDDHYRCAVCLTRSRQRGHD